MDYRKKAVIGASIGYLIATSLLRTIGFSWATTSLIISTALAIDLYLTSRVFGRIF